ncbi:MAG: AAA family ATPase [Methanosphaera sp. rholeuAM270]|nr:MAG: AAA family ATPase [Methanosphaera sp. rholeuAM270]
MHNLISRLIVYKNIKDPIFNEIIRIFNEFENENPNKNHLIDDIYIQINHLLNLATQYGFNNNLWHNYLAYILATTENPFTLVSEKVGQNDGSVNKLVKNDLEIFLELFNYDFTEIEKLLDIDCFTIISNYTAVVKKEQLYNSDVSFKVQELSREIESVETVEQMYEVITNFYKKYGVGKYGLNRAFQLSYDEDTEFIMPITSLDDVVLDDLIGYDLQKEKLIANTESFLQGKKANNVLLYGDAGTGKSTSIKAILNQYYPQGLRMIEVYKHEAQYLSKIIKEIKNRNYKFIIYMDDLSFEESESEYKYLKALIEGGLETRPDNVLIYATSNRRHLIKESWNERVNTSSSEELYHSDTIREKLSLVDRFGITIGYHKPSITEYYEIVKAIARKYPEITLSDDELEKEARKWLINHGAPSGRTAEQLVYHLLTRY